MFNKFKVCILAAAVFAMCNANAVSVSDGGFETNVLKEGVAVGNPIYTIGGEYISGNIKNGDVINSELCVVYDGKDEQSFTALTAVFDENEALHVGEGSARFVMRFSWDNEGDFRRAARVHSHSRNERARTGNSRRGGLQNPRRHLSESAFADLTSCT